MAQDHTGKVWIGWNQGGRLQVYANGAFQAVKVGGLNRWLSRIICDREGRMWFCTLGGVFYQDGDGLSRFTSADGLPHSAVKAVLHNREHQFWFATWNGVGRYDAHSINVFGLRANESRNPSEVAQIVQDRQGDI